MNKVTVKIEGMACPMCEAHICDAIRNAFPDAKKVAASRKHGEATFICESAISGEKLQKAISDTGYRFVSVFVEPYQKHGLFGR